MSYATFTCTPTIHTKIKHIQKFNNLFVTKFNIGKNLCNMKFFIYQTRHKTKDFGHQNKMNFTIVKDKKIVSVNFVWNSHFSVKTIRVTLSNWYIYPLLFTTFCNIIKQHTRHKLLLYENHKVYNL